MSSVGFTAAMDDALRSLAASDAAMKLATTELLARDATIERLDEDVAAWISRAVNAEAIIERVEALHVPHLTRDMKWCEQDQRSWPCPTIRALEETS